MRAGARIVTTDLTFVNAALLIGRIMMIVALIPNGLRKVATFGQTAAGMGGTPQMIAGRAFPDQAPLFFFPAPELFLSASLAFDLAGALLIALGWRTRVVATLLAVYVLLAMTIYHSDIRHAQDMMQLLRNLPFLGGLLILGGGGAGHWSLDGLFTHKASA